MIFFKNNAKFEFPIVILVGFDTPCVKIKKFKKSKKLKRGFKNTQKWLFFKKNQIWTLYVCFIRYWYLKCQKNKNKNLSSENDQFLCKFLKCRPKSDPLEPKRKKIQKNLFMKKCWKLWFRKSHKILARYSVPFLFYPKKTTGGVESPPPPRYK